MTRRPLRYFYPPKRKSLYRFTWLLLLVIIAVVLMVIGAGYYKRVFGPGPVLKRYVAQSNQSLTDYRENPPIKSLTH